ADSLHQILDDDLRLCPFVDRRAIDGVAAWWLAAVGPIEDAGFQIELKVDGLRQLIEQQLDVRAASRGVALGNIDVGAEDAAHIRIVWTLLRPVDLLKLRIDGDPDAPSRGIMLVFVATTRLDQRFDI